VARVRRATTRFFDRERGSGCCCLSHDFVCTLAHALLSQNNQNNQRVSIGVLALYVYSRVRMACACRVLVYVCAYGGLRERVGGREDGRGVGSQQGLMTIPVQHGSGQRGDPRARGALGAWARLGPHVRGQLLVGRRGGRALPWVCGRVWIGVR
jgi:hypothetical protein